MNFNLFFLSVPCVGVWVGGNMHMYIHVYIHMEVFVYDICVYVSLYSQLLHRACYKS